MGRKCNVPECLSEEGSEQDRGVTFHKVPTHPDVRPKWMSLCRIIEEQCLTKQVHVCSRHFLKANFCRFKGRKYMLRQGALPSVFPWNKLKKESEVKTDAAAVPAAAETSTDALKAEIKDEPMDVDGGKAVDHSSKPLNVAVKTESPTTDAIAGQVPAKSDKNQSSLADFEKAVNPASASTIEQKGKSIKTPRGVINFSINAKIEALDFNQLWYPARIVEVDYEENEVLIHFEKYSSKYDEWISMTSSRLRPLTSRSRKRGGRGERAVKTYELGEKCFAAWTDKKKFPAAVTKILGADTYEVLFTDGYVKIVKASKMSKMVDRGDKVEKVQASPLFDPVEGTKQDRRDKKRKLNVAELFGKKPRLEHAADLVPVVPKVEEAATGEQMEIWHPSWEDGQPVGVKSTIEASEGLRKSVIVPDPRLPPKWQRHLAQRPHGASAGKWESFMINPDGRRFRNRGEIKAYIEDHKELNLLETMFDFSLHRRAPRRDPKTAPPIEAPPQPAPPPPLDPPLDVDVKDEPNPNYLKIPLVDNAYKCPIEGCGKNFRRENLAQMHVKHYHPEYIKYMDSTPNVADLAYARTVGEHFDKSPALDRAKVGVKVAAKATPTAKQTIKAETTAHAPTATSTTQSLVPPTPPPSSLLPDDDDDDDDDDDGETYVYRPCSLPRMKDAEIIKLLNAQPAPEETTPKYPPGLPPNMYPDIKLKDLLNKSEGVPRRDDLNLRTLSGATVRPCGIKTLLPVVRAATADVKHEPKTYGDEYYGGAHACDSTSTTTTWLKTKSFKHGVKRKRQTSEMVDGGATLLLEPKQEPASLLAPNNNYIVEGGEIIKIVRMKQEEIINCTCGITEEDGLMMQCELCMCWQHAYCNNIQRENEVPDKYVCYICQHPVRQRSSKKYAHDQDWLKSGKLPMASYACKDDVVLRERFDKLKKSHDLSGGLIELKDFIHTLRTKIKIAETKNHPKLYLWLKPWEKRRGVSEAGATGNDRKRRRLDDTLVNNEDKVKEDVSESDFPKVDLPLMVNSVANVNVNAPIIPQPEAAIDSADCKLNLLEHIAHCQNLVEERMKDFEEQITELEGINLPINHDEDLLHTQRTVQLLVRDLSIIQEFSSLNTF